MAKKRIYDDDDGRTIADMSGVGRPELLSFRREGERPDPRPEQPTEEYGDFGPFQDKAERRMYILGALRAALLIALAFIAGLGLIVALMLLIWK